VAGRASVLWIAGRADAEAFGAATAAVRAGHAVSLDVAAGPEAPPPAGAGGVAVWALPPGEGEAWH